MATVIRKRINAPPGRPPRTANPIELPDSMRDRISVKTYELWHERGRREGRDLEDWLDAKTIVMEDS